MLPYIAEFIGTMLLILLGDGVVANVNLNKTGMKGAGSIQITFAWGLAVMLPAFTGLGAPHWDQYARGTIVGITRGVNKYHIIRATLESLAYQVNDVLQAMRADSGIKLETLKVDGGACANNLLMQMQADISNAPVNRPLCVETTAMGAAYLAGLAVGYWSSKEDVIKNSGIDRVFEPEISEEERTRKVNGWNKAVKYSYGWAKDD